MRDLAQAAVPAAMDGCNDLSTAQRSGSSAGFSTAAVADVRASLEGWLYFIQDGVDGPVKVGTATDLRQRLSNLQVGNPRRLHLIFASPGAAKLERQIQADLSPAHLGGEWYERDVALGYLVDVCGVPEETLREIGYEIEPS